MSNQKDLEFVSMVLQICNLGLKIVKKRKRRWWVRPLYRERSKEGFFLTTFKQVKNSDDNRLFEFTRLTRSQYDLLLSLVKDKLRKSSIRRPISPECRMVVALMYLSQGVSTSHLALTFRMGASTVRKIILEVCEVFWDVLSPLYMAEPNVNDWRRLSNEFDERWQMPHCVGSIDGKHIAIKCPPHSESKYRNHKAYHSLVLLAICDADYKFTAVDVGAHGSQNGGSIFRNSSFGNKIFSNEIDLPPPAKLPNYNEVAPFYFVADNAFQLRENVMRPYPTSNSTPEEEVFNFRIGIARSTSENAFGVLTARWRVLNKCVEFHPKNADKIILACTILHNFIRANDEPYNYNLYCPEGYCDAYDDRGERINGTWRQESRELLAIRRCGSNNRTEGASEVRELLTHYFVNEGRISCQPH